MSPSKSLAPLDWNISSNAGGAMALMIVALIPACIVSMMQDCSSHVRHLRSNTTKPLNLRKPWMSNTSCDAGELMALMVVALVLACTVSMVLETPTESLPPLGQ